MEVKPEKNFKVIVKRFGYPNGKLQNLYSEYFQTESEARLFAQTHTWNSPMETQIAEMYELKYDWCPVNAYAHKE